MNNLPCSVCGEAGHHPMRCPELCAPLNPGFSGANGGGGHGGDEEEHLRAPLGLPILPILVLPLASTTSPTPTLRSIKSYRFTTFSYSSSKP